MFRSKTFQTSEAQRRLLQYLAERALSGEADRLKEYTVGVEAFGKPSGYDPQEDSIVRTQTGRLRGKLREYYMTEGKNDPIVVEFPKGGFKLLFRPPEVEDSRRAVLISTPSPAPPEHHDGVALEAASPGILWMRTLPWALCGILLAVSLILGFTARSLRSANRALEQKSLPPWPLSRVVGAGRQTVIVGEDANLPKLRTLYGKAFTLEQYLDKGFPLTFLPAPATPRESQLMAMLATRAPPGNATLQTVRTILAMVPSAASGVSVRMPKEVRARDVRDGNHILIGSSISNPWASIFEHFLNFREVDQMVERGEKYFANQNPQPGEELKYQGIPSVGKNGFVYASVSLVPNEQRNGSVLLLAGLQSEGTEAAGLLLSHDEPRRRLSEAIRKLGGDPDRDWFEALIRARSVDATPGEVEIVAVRRIR